MNINEKLKKIRLENNLTQEEFANILNVSRSTIALYEKGIRTPDISIVNTVSKYFNCSIDSFYDDILNKKKKNKRTLKILTTITITSLFLVFTLIINHFIDINAKYGYNIYSDKLKVKNSSDICIVKINNLIDEEENCKIYSISVFGYLKRSESLQRYNFDKIYLENKVKNMEESKIYLVFNSIYKYRNNNIESNYYCDIKISHKEFVKELKDYNESISYDNQKGESQKIINYYMEIINNS